MRDAWNITSPSPDAQHTARFICGGEIVTVKIDFHYAVYIGLKF